MRAHERNEQEDNVACNSRLPMRAAWWSTFLTRYQVEPDHAGVVADHLIDAAAAGHGFAGLPRVFALVNHLTERPKAGPIEVVERGRNAALIDGGGHNGYITSVVAIDKAIDLAKRNGIGIVGVRNTWFSGRLAYYVERAAPGRTHRAAYGQYRGPRRPGRWYRSHFRHQSHLVRLSLRARTVGDRFGTGMTTWGEVLLREKLKKPLEPGWAVAADGQPTTDASEALAGAFLPWGGHRGYGIALVVQVLSILCGSKIVVDDVAECGFFFLVFDPELLMPLAEFRAKITELTQRIEKSRPAPGVTRVRVPGRGSAAARASADASGTITVDDSIYGSLMALREGPAR